MSEAPTAIVDPSLQSGKEQFQTDESKSQEGNSLPVQPEVNSSILETKRKQLVEAMERVQSLPESFVGNGKTKAELLDALREQIEGVRNELTKVRDAEAVAAEFPLDADANENIEVIEPEQQDEISHYITIGESTIPVCQPPKDKARWEAVVRRMYVEGGKKWSTVDFEKRGQTGLPQSLKPGEEIMFGERRGERLPVIDNILEGPGEVRAFNEVLNELATLQVQYESLNPDIPDYDKRASELAEKINRFTTGKLEGLVDLGKFRIADPEGFSDRIREIITTQQFLQEIDPESNEFIPAIDPNFKLTPFFQERMACFAQLINRQLGLGNNQMLEQLQIDNQSPEWAKLQAKGMTMVVGPRGTGKNKLADHYAAISQRPLFRYACSPDKTEYDLTYDVVLKDGEVVKIPSRIITAITTPNALLELDEVNLLNPAQAKFLNSLLDHDRSLFLNNEIITAAPGVVIVGLMNPADYEGVQNLPETIDDRSNAMSMGYPPFKDRDPVTGNERFTYDEALILKNHIVPLQHLSDEEFIKVWDYAINGTVGSVPVKDVAIIRIVKDLKDIISIANRTRETVKAHKTRTGNLRMDRDISLRGSTEAARFYSENHLWEANLRTLPDYRSGWNAASYAIATTYLPHTLTYKKGNSDKDALETLLAEQIR